MDMDQTGFEEQSRGAVITMWETQKFTYNGGKGRQGDDNICIHEGGGSK